MLSGLPQPSGDHDSEPFWRGCDEGRLRLQRCSACSEFRWPPGPVCPFCGSVETDWIDSAGRGLVYSWVIVQVPLAGALADQLPYAVGLIELEEGARIVSTIEDCEMTAISAGMKVTARFDAAGNGRRMLTFTPTRGRSA